MGHRAAAPGAPCPCPQLAARESLAEPALDAMQAHCEPHPRCLMPLERLRMGRCAPKDVSGAAGTG